LIVVTLAGSLVTVPASLSASAMSFTSAAVIAKSIGGAAFGYRHLGRGAAIGEARPGRQRAELYHARVAHAPRVLGLVGQPGLEPAQG
jgi:hypothetical protein